MLILRRLEAASAAEGRDFTLTFATFLTLPSVKTFVKAFDTSQWQPTEPQILHEISYSLRCDKIRLFDRIARCLSSDDTPLPAAIKTILDRETSAFIDYGPSNGLAPLHATLTDADIDQVLARADALFRCGICSAKLNYPYVALHILHDHDDKSPTAFANLPSAAFRRALKGLLRKLGADRHLERRI